MADEAERDRPTFSTFWKKSKEAIGGKRITFVSANETVAGAGAGSSDGNEQGLSAKDKAQVRRAQVRKAQIQHRQRKANYIKQLEIDVSKLRDMISGAEQDARILSMENEAIRLRLSGTVGMASAGRGPAAGSSPLTIQALPMSDASSSLPPSAVTSLFSTADAFNVPDMLVSLDFDDVVNYPCFQVASSPALSQSSWSSSGHSPRQQRLAPVPIAVKAEYVSPPPQLPSSPASPGESVDGFTGLTTVQADQAINFVLALEHVCWNHFPAGSWDPEGNDSGHIMMASALCVQSAPEETFKKFDATAKNLKSSSRKASGASPVAGDISWKAHGITLQSLLGLAGSLNPGDKELTPVQAWFELASQYNPNLLLSPRVLNGLKREFVGVVRCLHFGATIEREAFESVVGRVIGEELSIMSGFAEQPGQAVAAA